VDRGIIIDFDLHHGNGTQSLIMPLNAASHAEDIAVKAGKPVDLVRGKRKRGWKGFYGSVHDIVRIVGSSLMVQYSYPCEVGGSCIVLMVGWGFRSCQRRIDKPRESWAVHVSDVTIYLMVVRIFTSSHTLPKQTFTTGYIQNTRLYLTRQRSTWKRLMRIQSGLSCL
jgi:hypothetical protein